MNYIRAKASFSKSQLSVFLIVFAVLGLVLLIKSLAAPNPNLPGDLNNDNTVNVMDLSILLSDYNTSNSAADINSDGAVNVLDLSILLSHYGQSYSGGGTVFYVDPAGSDSNNGSQAAPWKTVANACASVPAGQDATIHVNAGAYTETATCNLQCMTNLSGAGSGSVTIKGSADPLINLANCSATTNAQTVSGLKLDGQNRSAGTRGMNVSNVYGLTINDLDSENFKGPQGSATGGGDINILNATKLDLGHSTFRNGGSVESNQCTGAVGLGNLYSSNIHDLTISENIGYGVKDSVIPSQINNTVFNNLNVTVSTASCSVWNTLAFELFDTDVSNTTIENSFFNATVSLTDNNNASSATYDIHNNQWTITSGSEYAIELDNSYAHVHNNYFSGGLYPVANFTSQTKTNNVIDHNVFDSQQGPTNCWHIDGASVNNGQFYNNTVVFRQSIQCLNFSGGETISIHDNIFYSTSSIGDKLGAPSGATIDNNVFYNLTAHGTNATTTNPQLSLSGGFPSAYIPSSGSPAAGLGAFASGSFTVGPQTGGTTSYLFDDEFSGSAGAAPDSSKWVNLDHIQYGGMTTSKAANAFLDGSGNLDLRVTRESWDGKSYAGGSVGTYQYQTGWPPLNIKASWPVPFRYEVRFKMPNVAGAWLGPGWNQNVDRTTSQNIYELDIGETRTTVPTWIGANQHTFLNGSDTNPQNGGGTVSDGRTNWHVVRADVTANSVTYYIDGTQVASYYGVSGRFGVQLHNEIADSGTWGSGGSQPAASDPGPWDMLIDYVRVSAL